MSVSTGMRASCSSQYFATLFRRHYGCAPREVWWDNPTTVVRELFKGRERRLHERYAALAVDRLRQAALVSPTLVELAHYIVTRPN